MFLACSFIFIPLHQYVIYEFGYIYLGGVQWYGIKSFKYFCLSWTKSLSIPVDGVSTLCLKHFTPQEQIICFIHEEDQIH